MSGKPMPDMWAVLAPLCAALSVGTLVLGLTAIRQIHPEIRMEFDALSGIAGGLAGLASWRLGRGIWRLGRVSVTGEARERLRRGVTGGFIVFAVLLLIGFAAATVGIPDGKRRDMIAGGLVAVLVLSGVGWVVWRLARLFGRPDDPAEDVS